MFDNIKPPCKAFAARGEQVDPRATALASTKLMVVFERPRMVAHLCRPRDEPGASMATVREVNQPCADGPTKAATIFANGKYAPTRSPSLS